MKNPVFTSDMWSQMA